MLYLTSDESFGETLELGLATGSMPPVFSRPHLEPQSVVSLELCSILPSGPMKLLLAEHTASWCLLSGTEAAVAGAACDSRWIDILQRYPQISEDRLSEFFVRLYQRGLLQLNGKPGLNPDLLNDGALFRDAYLVEVLVTQQCNLACRYCLAEAGPDMPHLHPEDAFATVDAAFNLPGRRPLSIQLSGGEPFVNFPLFKAVVQYAEQKQRETGRTVSVSTQSNGTLIDDEIAEFLRDHAIGVGISCDGPSELSNRSRPMLGGQASSERTLRGMRALSSRGVPFGVILVLNQINVGHASEIVDFFHEIGVVSLKINPVSMIGDAQLTWNDMAITGDQYFDFLNAFMNRVMERQIQMSEANLCEYLRYLIRRIHDYRCMRSNCGAGRSFFLVDASGDVYPCAHSAGIPSWRLGKIADANGDLVQLGAGNAFVQAFPARLVDRIEDARRCPWRHLCEGGCAVNAYQSAGTIQATDPLCGFYERFYPSLLQRLATSPKRFQSLLDLAYGRGRASVVEFALTGSSPIGLPADGEHRDDPIPANLVAN
jgi:uncharacterized protein